MDARTNLAKATPKSLRTRARILDAAMRLFAEVGYHAATNAVIADAARLTRGAMLYHFATREELVKSNGATLVPSSSVPPLTTRPNSRAASSYLKLR